MSERVVELRQQNDRGSFEDPGSEFERTPPQDVNAEQSVLGGMLLSKDAIADVVEVLRSTDFYRPTHQVIYDVILDLYGRGEPADAVTVAGELTRAGEIGRIGGAPYLHTLLSSVPTAANAGYYAKIVAERAILRRLVEAGTRVVQLGYASEGGEVDDLVDRAQQAIYDVTERRSSEDYVVLGDVMQPAMDEMEAISSRAGTMTGVPTGFSDLDTLTNGLHPGQLIVIAGRPGLGKSTLGLDVARSCSIKHGLTSAIFSLEMSKTEITMRLLSAEGRIGLHNMRTGTMSDDDWARLARRMGEVADAPLYIDDSPNLSMMEIRAKARRLRQRHDLRLVVIDYLQLMSGNKKAESRQQEVSELSRNLKLLAKELEVPVIAMSQLNRGPEQRTDKRPQLSDLRESGCLPASTRILRADDGREVTMGELFAEGARDVPVWSLDDSLRYVRRHLTHVFSTGHKPVLRLTLRSGKTVRATGNHPFLTQQGWTALDALEVGARLAVPRHACAPSEQAPVGDSVVSDLAASWPTADVAAVSDKHEIRMLVRRIWGRHGELAFRPSLACQSRRPLDALALLLLRFGISVDVLQDSLGWRLAVTERDDQIRFLGEIGVEDRDEACDLLLDYLVADRDHTRAVVDAPRWRGVERAMSGATAVLERVSLELAAQDLDLAATNDVLWDEVVSIEPDGVEEVFDATVVGTHNFIADGVAVHNSIEQDADMVILLHREDAYEKESPRAGEADFIVAKHRNGPTSTITVSFQGHYSRFVDMANG